MAAKEKESETSEKPDTSQVTDDYMSNHSEEPGSHNENSSEDEVVLPKGTPYSLHSKRLRLKCLHRISRALGLISDAVSRPNKGKVSGHGSPTLRHLSYRAKYRFG